VDYVLIRAWGIFMESSHAYIRDAVQTAHEDKAPDNAIYKADDGLWATIEDLNRTDRITTERIALGIMRRENPDHPLIPKREIQ
jgi:hypothetical protein